MVHSGMIKSIRHRGLKRLYERDETRGINAELLPRISTILALLDEAARPAELDLPGYFLHPLKGDRKGFWSLRISANFRIIFRMEDGDAYDIDLLDYH